MLLTATNPSWWTLAVPADSNGSYYILFYVLAFALNLGLLVWEGWRRGYPLRSWLVVLACTTLAFIMGTKLLALTGPEWQTLLSTGHWPDSEARTVLGGALASTLTLLALRRPFGFSWHVFDAFTLPMCAALVVQCVGCILTGCCFGELTAAGWGFTYPPDTLPYLVQAAQGKLPVGAPHSLPVHPTQLYSLLLCAGVGLVLLATRHRTWPGGSRRLLHLGLLLTGRFLIEFWRDPAGEQVGSVVHAHAGLALKQVQWVLLLLGPAILSLWAWQLYRVRVPQPERLPTQKPVRNLLAVVALLVATAWLGPRALVLPEVVVIKTLLLAVLALEGGYLLLRVSDARPARVALPLGLACAVFMLTSQVPAADSSGRASYTTISGGLSRGSFERLQGAGGSGGCGGSSELLAYRHRYTTGTLDVSHTKLQGQTPASAAQKWEFTYGLRLHGGSDLQTSIDSVSYRSNASQQNSLVAINPYIQTERNWFGVGLGVLAGNLGYSKKYFGDDQSLFDIQASLRLGRRESLYALADYNYLGYGPGNPLTRLGVGLGFGGTRWQLLGGAATHKTYETLPGQPQWSGFAEAQGSLTPRWQASTFLTFGNRSQQQAGVRVGYRIPSKQR